MQRLLRSALKLAAFRLGKKPLYEIHVFGGQRNDDRFVSSAHYLLPEEFPITPDLELPVGQTTIDIAIEQESSSCHQSTLFIGRPPRSFISMNWTR